MILAILFFSALFTSVISGLIGMGGGVTLLAVMTFFFPLNILVPIHGSVQFTSNLSRTYLLRKYIRREAFLPFLLAVPIGSLGVWVLLKHLSRPEWVIWIVIVLLFYVAFKPKKLPEIRVGKKGFFLLGVVGSFLGALIGATGPLLAPFFARSDYKKEEIVATKAACQILVHLVKFPIFLSLSFAYESYWKEILVMIFGVVIGTRIGIELLKKVSFKRFMIILKTALALTGLRLLYKMLA